MPRSGELNAHDRTRKLTGQITYRYEANTPECKTGETALQTVPPPTLKSEGVRVRTAVSLISAGAEKMLIDLAQRRLRREYNE
jgi:hypothetical protein